MFMFTLHTSHLTSHISHLTPNTSHLTPHISPHSEERHEAVQLPEEGREVDQEQLRVLQLL